MVYACKVEREASDGKGGVANFKFMAAMAANESNTELKALQEQTANLIAELKTTAFVGSRSKNNHKMDP